jgi:hypothetical protein
MSIAVCKQGDSDGVWFVGILLSSKSRLHEIMACIPNIGRLWLVVMNHLEPLLNASVELQE